MDWAELSEHTGVDAAPRAGFSTRQIGPSASEQRQMLASLGLTSLDELVEQAMPAEIRSRQPLDLPPARDEARVAARMRELAGLNHPRRAMIGMGYYGTVTPAVLRRNVLENPGWYTAYTPYQPEISQGRLEALLTFQTMVSELSALPVAGSSLLDEATAVAEAVALAHRVSHGGRNRVLVEAGVLPQTLAVLHTRMDALGIEVVLTADPADPALLGTAFAVVVQTPTVDGGMQSTAELRALAAAAHAAGAQVIAAADLLALTLVVPPGQWGADIAAGSTQRFGVPLFYGGPHAGYIAVRAELVRQLPGRLVGVSRDADGALCHRLALQTREQHIRREKATSNICTAQVLLAVMAGMFGVFHGPEGLRAIARGIHERTRLLAGVLVRGGFGPLSAGFFDTLTVRTPGAARQIVARAAELGVHLRRVDHDTVGISVGQDATDDDLDHVVQAFGLDASQSAGPWGGLGAELRTDEFMTHPVFRAHHSETQLMRHLRSLQNRDFALDTGMIPLGSCTMKLNPAVALEAISLPGFADLHPFAPVPDAQGYRILVEELSGWLQEISGYAGCSLQPNSGAAGEFAGLSAIRAYHRSRGEGRRTVCLIPSSAHGTNAASAAMAGLKVVVVASDEQGQIDLDDLGVKLAAHRDTVAAAMVTYPSTHGVFEDTITRLCAMVHDAGGQVYIDGANMNALAGLAQPGRFGGDVSHLNLHKTFAIPHGGGGPGVGPILVADHLIPFLPDHPVVAPDDPRVLPGGAVAGAPFGSAGVLPISYAYIALMGPDGLRRASQVALLNANYIAHRLDGAYPVLFAGTNGLVAHECILDCRPITRSCGITVEDIAKRLIDYGFHAPTMSFPVPGTLMVEPTESEDLAELDRFCDAMLDIRGEIEAVRRGHWPARDNPLVNAPHTLARVSADEWTHPYSRSLGGFPSGHRPGPLGGVGRDKYWPAVARIDAAFGDRHLVCSCPPPQAYETP